MMELLVATANRDKLLEIEGLLADLPVRLRSLADVALGQIEETGATLAENACQKALSAARQAGCLVIADDTGLCVDALGGAPGVQSARYAGETASYEDNCRKLLAELEGVPGEARGARFVTVVACADPEAVRFTVTGEANGVILETPRGTGGFGYDPLFYLPSLGHTFAELDTTTKNTHSHRGHALRALRERLAEWLTASNQELD